MTWQLQEAKNKLSEVVEKSINKGPQIISRRGKNTAVVISFQDYQRYMRPKNGLKKALMSGPIISDLDIERDKSTTGRATPFSL